MGLSVDDDGIIGIKGFVGGLMGLIGTDPIYGNCENRVRPYLPLPVTSFFQDPIPMPRVGA